VEEWTPQHEIKRSTGRNVRPVTDVTSIALGKKGRRYTVRIFGTKNLMEGAM
jgi:uncharacterized protein (DUF3084 family)